MKDLTFIQFAKVNKVEEIGKKYKKAVEKGAPYGVIENFEKRLNEAKGMARCEGVPLDYLNELCSQFYIEKVEEEYIEPTIDIEFDISFIETMIEELESLLDSDFNYNLNELKEKLQQSME